MNRGNMRTLLRRRLDDPVPEDGDPVDLTFWSDAMLDDALNVGASKLQQRVMIVDPAAFLQITEQNLQANNWKYPKPAGSWSLLDLRMLNDAGDTYVSLGTPVDVWDLDKVALSGGTTTRFGFFGRFVKLSPTPTANRTNGLQWWFVEGVAIETGTAHDTEAYPFPTGLHDLLVLLAQEFLLPEQTDDAADALRKVIASAAEAIPFYYRRSLGPEVGFSIPGVDKKGSGQGSNWMTGQGVPFGSSW